MNRLPLLVLSVACGLLPLSYARGEVFILTNGGRVEGDFLNREESPRKTYVLQTPLGGQLTLTKSQVERVVLQKDSDKQYEDKLRKMPNTKEGHLEMAEWCRVNDLRAKRQYHLEKVIELDPDHESARHGLGFNKIDGRWLKSNEYMKSQGYIRHRGSWRLKQEVDADAAADKFKDDVVAWKKKLRLLRTRFDKRGDGQALAEMRLAAEPAASVAFADLLANEDYRELKLLYIEMMGQIPTGAGTAALIRHSLNDADESIREACLRELAKHGTQQAVAVYIKALTGKDNGLINRAGAGLAHLGQDDAVLPLIEALVTQHKTVVQSGGGLSPSFGTGGAGLSAGSKTTTIINNISNESVLGALRAITHEDFQFDKGAWREWYIDSRTPKNVNLRRSE